MSFHIQFTARTPADAIQIVAEETYLPAAVRDFIIQGLTGLPDDGPVNVKATGHLFNGKDYNVSNGIIEVTPLSFRVPKPIPVATPTEG